MGYYLAIDLGMKVGRCILGHLENEKLCTEEVYHFENSNTEEEGGACWDLTYLLEEIKKGMNRCREIGRLPIFVGIDAWGLGFILLDHEDKVIGNTITDYNNCMDETEDIIQNHNIYDQLEFFKECHTDYKQKVKSMLMLPDFLNFLLTGVKLCEYTMAAATQLINPVTKTWDDEKITGLGYSVNMLHEIRRPGTVFGNLTRAVTEEIGYDCIIVLPATCAINSARFAFPSVDAAVWNKCPEVLQIQDTSKDCIKCSAAAVGNLLVQMIISHELKDVQAAQQCAQDSFVIKNEPD